MPACSLLLRTAIVQESEEDEGYSYARLSATAAGSRSASAEPAAPHAGAAKGMPAPAGSRPGSAQAGAGSGSAPHPQPAHHLQVEPSSRSAGVLGARPPPPGEQAGPRPQTAGAALGGQPSEEQQQQGPPSYRPASIHSARGAEYFNHAPSSSGGSHPDTDGGLHYRTAGVGGAASLPAHTRLYADHFRKQQRLEEERRLRWGPPPLGRHTPALWGQPCAAACMCMRSFQRPARICPAWCECMLTLSMLTLVVLGWLLPPQGPGDPAEDGAGAHCARLQQAGLPPYRRVVPQLRRAAVRGGAAGGDEEGAAGGWCMVQHAGVKHAGGQHGVHGHTTVIHQARRAPWLPDAAQ